MLQDEQKQIQAQADLIRDFYTGRLNAAGRAYLNTVLGTLNQDCYLRPADDVAVAQEVPAVDRPTIIAVEGVKSADEIDRCLKGLWKFNSRLLEKQESQQKYYFISFDRDEIRRTGTSRN